MLLTWPAVLLQQSQLSETHVNRGGKVSGSPKHFHANDSVGVHNACEDFAEVLKRRTSFLHQSNVVSQSETTRVVDCDGVETQEMTMREMDGKWMLQSVLKMNKMILRDSWADCEESENIKG
jgi:hypothetical protein